MERVSKLLPLLLLGLLIVTVFIWASIVGAEQSGVMKVAFLDVGQGDAIFIESPTGVQVLVDGGPNDSVLKELSKQLSFFDRDIDIVIATHPDADHIGGLPRVFEKYEIRYVIDPGVANDTALYDAYIARVEAEGAARLSARRGTVLDIGGGATLTILFPDRGVEGVNINDASVITRLSYGDIDFLLTGDAPNSIENYIAGLNSDIVDVEVLKVGHHGSKTSTSERFVGLASPFYAVISAGRENRYGHPHEEVLQTLNQFEAQVLGTYDLGTIIFETDGRELVCVSCK